MVRKQFWIKIFLFVLYINGFSQSGDFDLYGRWNLFEYYSPDKGIVKKIDRPCGNFLSIEIKKNGKLTFVFKAEGDSVYFSGKYKLKNNNITIWDKIHEVMYLGKMQNCISVKLRIELREMLRTVNSYKLEGDTLILYFLNKQENREIRLMRQGS
jgi:hypothetical protein